MISPKTKDSSSDRIVPKSDKSSELLEVGLAMVGSLLHSNNQFKAKQFVQYVQPLHFARFIEIEENQKYSNSRKFRLIRSYQPGPPFKLY